MKNDFVKSRGSWIVALKRRLTLLGASVHMIHSVQGIVKIVASHAGVSTSTLIQDVEALASLACSIVHFMCQYADTKLHVPNCWRLNLSRCLSGKLYIAVSTLNYCGKSWPIVNSRASCCKRSLLPSML